MGGRAKVGQCNETQPAGTVAKVEESPSNEDHLECAMEARNQQNKVPAMECFQ